MKKHQTPSTEHAERPSTRRASAKLSGARASIALTMIMWPLALMTFAHKTFLSPFNDHPTDDFTTVISALRRFRAHIPVYNEDYSTVDPHYLYSPGGTLLLSPMAYLPEHLGRPAYIVLNAVATVLAIAVLTKLFRFSMRGPVLPAATFIVFSTEAVQNTLLFSNINGLLLFAEAGFLYFLIHRRDILAGLVIGLAIVVKPQFAPLLFLPLVRRQLSTILVGLGIPIALNLAAIPLMVSPGDYLDKLVPYLGQVRDYANSSISGIMTYFGFSDTTILLWRVLAAICVIISIVLLLRWRDRDEVMWVTTTAGVLLVGVFLISSLGQMYYSMLLVPMFFTVLRSQSVMHSPIAWLGVYFCMSLDEWMSDRWVWAGRIFEYSRGTIGWGFLLVSITTTVVVWTLMERKQGRHILGDFHENGWWPKRGRAVAASE
ncbi:glycosyltransferase family 87 protein [uncultured Corynebacterium sp.]|uniref:glycosyltransferase family 87 protein n=1 Tax=uncultured Corynebacterium sp. TaxID=159447 RepID=UPI0025E8694B|nr:glycosyltransferase family 87 protein [uncultured Corynebacterium sp.]